MYCIPRQSHKETHSPPPISTSYLAYLTLASMFGEQQHIDLIFRASKKFANWDPEDHLEVGDWGRLNTGRPRWAFWRPKCCLTKLWKYGIPSPRLLGEENPNGLTWVTSLNARDMDIPTNTGKQGVISTFLSVGGLHRGSWIPIHVWRRDGSSSRALGRLLGEVALRDRVVVSETHRCASYASACPKWVRTNKTGYFKGKADNSGERKYYPLYKLVSVRSDGGNTGRRSLENTVDGEAPLEVLSLPSALPPWTSSA
ncbi:hypothetical protein EDD17DRAFT_1505132 [Pisolithus thermaeus]|nr:hypothetical protein EV401DRAFT_1887348 [Pisolithus croceorrhizus]KAI6166790.1 hypothetical protein EDD17DRAFT_1505132 [Pisolithus thermaeus]